MLLKLLPRNKTYTTEQDGLYDIYVGNASVPKLCIILPQNVSTRQLYFCDLFMILECYSEDSCKLYLENIWDTTLSEAKLKNCVMCESNDNTIFEWITSLPLWKQK